MRLLSLSCALFGLLACAGDEVAAPEPGACQVAACPPATCGPDERADALTGGCAPLGWRECPAGFVLDTSGFGCTDVLPAAACPSRTMPVLGETVCAPVAAKACAAGFEADPGGWGCRAVVASTCTGATMEVLGQAACVAVGDCAATFPPPGATHIVDAAFTAGQIDATHFKTIGAALGAAPAGALIAVQSGTYTETLTPPRSARIVGRCPAQVTVASPAGTSAGVHAQGAVDVMLEGLTLTGHLGAVLVDGGASVTVRSVVMDANRGGGVIAAGAGTRMKIERSVVRGSIPGDLTKGYGVEASAGADLMVVQSAVIDNTAIGIHVVGKGAHGSVDRSVVARTSSDAAKDFGNGVVVRNGASADIASSAVAQNHEIAVVSYGAGTSVTVRDTTITGTKNSRVGYGRGVLVDGAAIALERVTISGSTDGGIVAEAKGTATVTDSVVQGTTAGSDGTNGFGIAVIQGSAVTIKGSAIVGNRQSGVAVLGPGSKLVANDSLVADTLPDGDGGRGFGIDLETGGVAEVRGSALIRNTSAGAGSFEPGSKLTMSGSVIGATRADGSKKGGLGITIEAGGAGAITASAIVGNRDVGIAARGAGSSLTVDQTVVRGTLPLDSDGTHGRGIEVGSGAKGSVARTSVLQNHGGAVVSIAEGSAIDMQNTWIADTIADARPGAPGRAVTVQNGASMTMLGVVAQRSRQAGVVVAGAGASLVAKSSRIDEVAHGENDQFGHGIVAVGGATVVLDDVSVTRCTAVALAFDGARGTVRACRVTDNAVGISVQGGTELQQVTAVPEAPSDNVVSVSIDTTFTGNGTRVGSGVVPLPAPL